VIPAEIARVLKLPEAADPLAQIAERAGQRPLLIVLDNLEHLPGASHAVAEVLAASDRIAVLATSRVALGIEAERIERVPEFAVSEHPESESLAALWANPGARLFLDRARWLRAHVEKNVRNGRAIAEICRRLDGLPLAIELAASRSRVFGPEEIRDRLAQSLDLLVSPEFDVDDRLRTMRGAIQWSYDLLSPDDQAFFRRLAIFPGGFSHDTAAKMAVGWSAAFGYPAGGLPDPTVLDWQAQLGRTSPAELGPWDPPELDPLPIDPSQRLDALIEHHLIDSRVDVSGHTRFSMPETMREFGIERLRAHGELAATEHAFAVTMMAVGELGGLQLWTSERLEAIARLKHEIDNFRATFAWAARQTAPADQIAARMAESLWQFWQTCGYAAEGAFHIERALARNSTNPITRAATLCVLGVLRWSRDDIDGAQAALDEALGLSAANGYEVGEAHGLTFMALVDWSRKRFEAMAEHTRASFDLYSRQQDRVGMAISLVMLSIIARKSEEFDQALNLLTEAAQRSEETKYLWGLATAQYFHGETLRAKAAAERDDDPHAAEKDEAEAFRFLRDGFANYQRQDESLGMAGCLAGLAGLAAARGSHRRAARLLAAAGKMRDASGSFLPETEEESIKLLNGAVYEALGDEAYHEALAVGLSMPLEHVIRDAGRVLEREAQPIAESRPASSSPLLTRFTKRQREVASLLMNGATDQQIADKLFISRRTVSRHLSDMYKLAGVPNRASLIGLLARDPSA
jgi:non-specific serine/threonine protein kinase